ncbi:hypothetical protein Btru_050601 [Bulinus truncatus]|nr:hypothetical protein Btru_050601 [Bulinus truncatus]
MLASVNMATTTNDQKSNAKIEALHQTPSEPEIRFEQMPDVVIGKIMSYLHWLEREWLLLAAPSTERIMNSPLAWETFENDRNYPIEILHVYNAAIATRELTVVERYGRYFQTCSLRIHKMSRDEENGDSDCQLLKAVTDNCPNLKLLCLIHPPDVTISELKSFPDKYIRQVKSLAHRGGENFRLCLSRLFYSSVSTVSTGISRYLHYLQDNELLGHISCLDFSHGLVFDCRCETCLPDLVKCVNIRTLKCPVHSVNTLIILSLANKKLKILYLVNDDHTQEAGFFEKMYLDWGRINRELARGERGLMVHYIFRNRAMCDEDLFPNPLLRSLVFDNLSSNISAKMLRRIADQYGATLQVLAFCSNYWEFLMHFADLGQINESFKYLGRNCVNLTSFLSCLSLPSSALVCMVQNSGRLTTVRVFKENIRLATSDKPEGVFLLRMAKALGLPRWDMNFIIFIKSDVYHKMHKEWNIHGTLISEIHDGQY